MGSELDEIVERLRTGRRFVISSHQRPDGDAIGSAMAAACALRAMGKQADVVFDAVPPSFLQPFPGVDGIRVVTAVDETYDASVVMECSALERTAAYASGLPAITPSMIPVSGACMPET